MSSARAPFPEDLAAGFRRFRSSHYQGKRGRRWKAVADGALPANMVVACSDARSAPEVVFDAGPGELFVLRNVASVVPVHAPDGRSHAAGAALEFAVLGLQVGSIVVLGHDRCIGIAAVLDDPEPMGPTEYVGAWVAGMRGLLADVEPRHADDPVHHRTALERATVEQSIAHLRTFPWIRSREESGVIGVHGAWFDILAGELYTFNGDAWTRLGDT